MPAVLGEEIRKRRLRLGLKKSQLAAMCGVSYKTLDNLEHSRTVASRELVHRLANAFDAKAEDLFVDASDAA